MAGNLLGLFRKINPSESDLKILKEYSKSKKYSGYEHFTASSGFPCSTAKEDQSSSISNETEPQPENLSIDVNYSGNSDSFSGGGGDFGGGGSSGDW